MKKIFLLWLFPAVLMAQSSSNTPKYEMRGAWIATVINLDWPIQRDTPTNQQAALIRILDKLKSTGINAVFFQVRSESDAMYQSDLEPWSVYLTGEQGKAPNPAWDPLAFAIAEAHKRGMELHAWINPFRVIRDNAGTYPKHPLHVSVKKPEWMLKVGNVTIIDPGIPEARAYIIEVAADIVKRYGVDGIHYDDYFYPYSGMKEEDVNTFTKYGEGFRAITEWRRYNINQFVKDLDQRVKAINPHIKHGISPFGIWKSGVPTGITGLSAYDTIYADAVTWMEQKWIDYLSPQLYWAFGGGQDYAKLAPWWKSQLNGRHLYPGLAPYRADAGTAGSATMFKATEVPNQIRFNRKNGIGGQLFFRAQNLTGDYASQGIADSLRLRLNTRAALTPIMEFKDKTPPAPPKNLTYFWNNEELLLFWAAPDGTTGIKTPQRYAVYRVQSATEPDLTQTIANGANLIGVTGQTNYKDKPTKSAIPYWYFVTSVSLNSVESTEKVFIASLEGRAVANEVEVPVGLTLGANFPNPFSQTTSLPFSLDRSAQVTVRLINPLGQEVAKLAENQVYEAGSHQITWGLEGQEALPNGVYFLVFEMNGFRSTRKLVLLR